MNDRLWPAIRRRLPIAMPCDHGGTGQGHLQWFLEWQPWMPSPSWKAWCAVCGATAKGWVNEIEAETEQEEAMRFRREPPKSDFTEALRRSLPVTPGCAHDRSMTWSTVRGMRPTFYEVRCDSCGAQSYYNRETGNHKEVQTVKTSTQRKIEDIQRTVRNLQEDIDELRYQDTIEDSLRDALTLFDNKTVIAFEMKFASGSQVYSYSAIKTNNRWYTTGPNSPKSYSSTELAHWIVQSKIGPVFKLWNSGRVVS